VNLVLIVTERVDRGIPKSECTATCEASQNCMIYVSGVTRSIPFRSRKKLKLGYRISRRSSREHFNMAGTLRMR
jgi:hypothetical protein